MNCNLSKFIKVFIRYVFYKIRLATKKLKI